MLDLVALLSTIIFIAHSSQPNVYSRLLNVSNEHEPRRQARVRTRSARYRVEDAWDEARASMDFALNVRGGGDFAIEQRRKRRVAQWTKLLCLGACIYGLTPICHGPLVKSTTFAYQADCLFFCCPAPQFGCCKEAALVGLHALSSYFWANMITDEQYCHDCNAGQPCHRSVRVPEWVQNGQQKVAEKYQCCCGCLINKILVDRCKMYPENGAELTDNEDDEDKQPVRAVRFQSMT